MKKVTPSMPSDCRQAIEAHAMISRATSEGALPEPEGPSGSLRCDGVVGLRVESAEALCAEWEKEINRRNEAGIGWMTNGDLVRCLKALRRLMETATVRQPEPNMEGSHTEKKAPHSP